MDNNITGMDGENSSAGYSNISDGYYADNSTPNHIENLKKASICILILLIVVGVFGNIISFVVFLKGRRCSRNIFSLYFKALAIADLYVLISHGIPFALMIYDYSLNIFAIHDVMCKFAVLNYPVCFQVSAWITVAVTIDRTITINSSVRYHKLTSAKYIYMKIVLIIVIFIAANVYFSVNAHIYILPGEQFCYSSQEESALTYHLFSVVVTLFILPVVITTVCNVILLRVMYRRAANTSGMGLTPATAMLRRTTARHTTYKVIAICVLQFVANAPMAIISGIHTLEVFKVITSVQLYSLFYDVQTFQGIRHVNVVLMYLCSSFNFILYCMVGSDFRRDLKDIFML